MSIRSLISLSQFESKAASLSRPRRNTSPTTSLGQGTYERRNPRTGLHEVIPFVKGVDESSRYINLGMGGIGKGKHLPSVFVGASGIGFIDYAS